MLDPVTLLDAVPDALAVCDPVRVLLGLGETEGSGVTLALAPTDRDCVGEVDGVEDGDTDLDTDPETLGPPTPVVPGAQGTPGGHSPEHCGEARPHSAPNTPAGHGLHSAAPSREKVPGGHWTAVVLGDRGGQA